MDRKIEQKENECKLPVIVGVSHDDLFLNTETESVRGVELSFSRPELSKLASEKKPKMNCQDMSIRCSFSPDLHRIQTPLAETGQGGGG